MPEHFGTIWARGCVNVHNLIDQIIVQRFLLLEIISNSQLFQKPKNFEETRILALSELIV